MSEDSNDNKQTSLVQIGRKNICPVVDCQTVNFEWVKKVKKKQKTKKNHLIGLIIYIYKKGILIRFISAQKRLQNIHQRQTDFHISRSV